VEVVVIMLRLEVRVEEEVGVPRAGEQQGVYLIYLEVDLVVVLGKMEEVLILMEEVLILIQEV
jgi:hypothetical protein